MGKRKTIVCLETGKQFNSVENAANAIGVSSGFISRQIKAGKPIKGFYYYYAGEMLPDEYRQKIRNQKKKPNYKSRPVICLETGERFESISLVSRMLGISKSNVFHAMKNGSAVHGIHFYYGDEPNATVAYLSSLEGSREERAFELAKNEYLAWLEHKADRYTTVYGYMD